VTAVLAALVAPVTVLVVLATAAPAVFVGAVTVAVLAGVELEVPVVVAELLVAGAGVLAGVELAVPVLLAAVLVLLAA
jgi:hypothetical protein